ncbi:mRNA export factor Mex67p [[Candida] jaroonii]|uniref:mRNA export factor Mex67p n=1 Tax=[Candida] jaroonii TaxID=467808 RepID=A0ACA9Y7X4_9ASCO|nr:mRNA export factor Mex67p [[Candida] jaroonii]
MSYRGRGRGNYNNYGRGGFQRPPNPQNINQYVNSNSIPVEIAGWNGASMEDCINFISRKCRIVVSNANIEPNGNIKGYVKSEKEAGDLLNWSGVKFAGQSLKITKSFSSNGTNKKGNTIETITEFLKTRYDEPSKMLNLSSVQNDATLNQQGFFASISTTSKFFPALMKIASDLKIDVESIDLSNNNLNDLNTITTLPQTFPKLINLSLMNNNLSKLKVFEIWKNKLNYLREFIISGNPILNNDLNVVKLEIMRLFPRLIILNGEVLRNEPKLLENLKFPFNSQSMMFQDNDIHNISTNFITNFYNLWDTNRSNLLQLYQDQSQFSVSVDMSNPHDLNGQQIDFTYYLTNSRNLSRISASKLKMQKLFTGKDQIANCFNQLPKSKHELIENSHLFSMEAFKYNQLNGIIINLHGTFKETGHPDVSEPKKYGRKKVSLMEKGFDRCFVIIPSPDGGMIVASDMLVIRYPTIFKSDASPVANASPSPAPGIPPVAPSPPVAAPGMNQTPGMTAAPPANSPGINDLPPDIKSMINVTQQELLVKVLLETNLNLQYGYMLCEQSNWDYQTCTINFKNSVNSLPLNAYR